MITSSVKHNKIERIYCFSDNKIMSYAFYFFNLTKTEYQRTHVSQYQ